MRDTDVAIRIPSHARFLDSVRGFFREFVGEFTVDAFDPQELAELELGLQEACVNAIRHGAPTATDPQLDIRFRVREERLTIEVRDQGAGFDPSTIPAPDPFSLQERGYGLFIIRRTMDRLEARRDEDGFVIEMTRYLPAVVAGGAGGRT